jgi:plastocyanin
MARVVTPQRSNMFGSGLSPLAYATVLLGSIALFLAWGGLLWHAPRGASHVMRFVVSYCAVIPIVALILWRSRSLSWTSIVTAIGTMWAIKMILTAGLYQAFAHSNAWQLEGVAPPPPSNHAPAASYTLSPTAARGTIYGVIPGGRAIVFIEAPPPGAALPASTKLNIAIDHAAYDQPLLLAHTGDTIALSNHDRAVHTLQFRKGESVADNLALLGGASASLDVPEAGVYRLTCENRADGAALVVTEHPYAVITGEDGSFRFEVPAGKLTIVAVRPRGADLQRTTTPADVAPEATLQVGLSFPTKESL